MDKTQRYENLLRRVHQLIQRFEDGRIHVNNYNDEMRALKNAIREELLAP